MRAARQSGTGTWCRTARSRTGTAAAAAGVVPAVADQQALAVVDVAVVAGVLARWSAAGPWQSLRGKVTGSLPEGLTSPNSTVASAVPVCLAGVPGLEHGRDLVEPRHRHRAGGVQHDDGARVGRGDRGDQLVLVGRAAPACCGPSPRWPGRRRRPRRRRRLARRRPPARSSRSSCGCQPRCSPARDRRTRRRSPAAAGTA